MRNSALVSAESVSFRSIPGVAGIEILDAENTSRHWKWLNTAFGLAVPTTWHGEVRYRRRQQAVNPGMAFCPMPGEIHTTPRVHRTGTFQAFMIEPAVFQEYVAEHGTHTACAAWSKPVQLLSPSLAGRIKTLLGAPPAATAMEIQTRVVDLFEAIARELIERAVPARSRAASANAAMQIRECLHSEEGATLDLSALAQKFGMSHFQVLRTFRTRYGVPPHAYQICARVARARTLLKGGLAPVEVSAQCGFSDQSHFGRHFKRVVGTTPAQYARATNSAPRAKLHGALVEPAALSVLTRP